MLCSDGGLQMDAFEIIAAEWSSWYSLAQKLVPFQLRHVLEPEDILQDAYLAALRSRTLPSGEPPTALRRWFHGVILNTVRNLITYHRRHKRRHRDLPFLHEEPGSATCDDPLPLERLLMREELTQAIIALESLPPRQALLLIYVCFYDVPLGAAAAQLGIPSQTASRLLYRAKATLRDTHRKSSEHESRDS
jgi:RNA polymerase sigma factor (sigma-70 family)